MPSSNTPKTGKMIPVTCKVSFCKVIIAGLAIFFFFSINSFAQGNLLITPRRVVFEGSKKSMDLNLANIGSDTATYAISIIQIRMKDDGGFETITEPDPGQLFADRYIRFFPRTVTLGPNEAQVVKVQLTKTSELNPGEYRSHFYFRSVPKVKPLGEKEKVKDSTTITIELTPIFGITIPVIIKKGTSDTKVTLSDVSLTMVNDTIPKASFIFHRSGNMSCFGDITIDYISSQGVTTRVATANGVSVYTPNAARRFQLNLKKISGVDYATGKLHITYSAPSDVKPAKYAEIEYLLK